MVNHNDEEFRSTAEKLIAQAKKQEVQQSIIEEEMADWKDMLLRLFSTKDGIYLGQKLFQHSGCSVWDPDVQPVALVAQKGKSEFYLRYVRPFLDNKTLNKIERKKS